MLEAFILVMMRNTLLRQALMKPLSSGMWEIKRNLQGLKGIRIGLLAFILVMMRNYLLQEAMITALSSGMWEIKRNLQGLKGIRVMFQAFILVIMRNYLLRQAMIKLLSSGMWEIKRKLQRLKGIRVMFQAFILVMMRNYLLQEASIKPLSSGMWESSNARIARLKGHTDYVNSVHFSHDAKYLASGSWDNTIILWDVGNKTQVATLKGHTHWVRSVHFSHDAEIPCFREASITLLSSGMWEIKRKLQGLKGIRVPFIAFILVLMRNTLLLEALITPFACGEKCLMRMKKLGYLFTDLEGL